LWGGVRGGLGARRHKFCDGGPYVGGPNGKMIRFVWSIAALHLLTKGGGPWSKGELHHREKKKENFCRRAPAAENSSLTLKKKKKKRLPTKNAALGHSRERGTGGLP